MKKASDSNSRAIRKPSWAVAAGLITGLTVLLAVVALLQAHFTALRAKKAMKQGHLTAATELAGRAIEWFPALPESYTVMMQVMEAARKSGRTSVEAAAKKRMEAAIKSSGGLGRLFYRNLSRTDTDTVGDSWSWPAFSAGISLLLMLISGFMLMTEIERKGLTLRAGRLGITFMLLLVIFVVSSTLFLSPTSLSG